MYSIILHWGSEGIQFPQLSRLLSKQTAVKMVHLHEQQKRNPYLIKEWKVKQGLREINLFPYLILQWLRKGFWGKNRLGEWGGTQQRVVCGSSVIEWPHLWCRPSIKRVSFTGKNKKHSWTHTELHNKEQCDRGCQMQASWQGFVVEGIWAVF